MSSLSLYGHPFSSYTWKALIALYANNIPFEFRILDENFPEHAEVVQQASPQGKFPVLADGEVLIFEATSIIEYLAVHYPGPHMLLPASPDAATAVRTLDRVFDNYVMNIMQHAVAEALRHPGAPDEAVLAEVRASLRRSYAWLERWVEHYALRDEDHITLIECAAAPSLFYADWVEEITDEFPRLKAWRAHLNGLPAVARCIDEARPYRPYFPLGAPDRD
jgi:glutathione S-transferase